KEFRQAASVTQLVWFSDSWCGKQSGRVVVWVVGEKLCISSCLTRWVMSLTNKTSTMSCKAEETKEERMKQYKNIGKHEIPRWDFREVGSALALLCSFVVDGDLMRLCVQLFDGERVVDEDNKSNV
uniref:Uncharacterized protein n=1 Tax=Parascaris equorum TaxID=6256 RepID=A0A914RLT2_PAREQ